ncbi:hypothetical protein AAG906_020184 [Vitis piasezkii]
MPLVDHFAQASSVAKSSLPPCEAISSPFRTPQPPRRSRAIHLSSISAMGRVPSSPPQRRYSTRRPPISRPQSHQYASGSSQFSGPEDTQRSSGIAPEVIIKRPMVLVLCDRLDLRDLFGLLRRYHLERLMTPRGSTTIRFNIDERQDILEARHIAETLHIPFQPEDLEQYRQWTSTSQRNMVRILSRGTLGDTCLLRKELPSRMLLVDVLLRSNIFPLHIQCRGEDLFWMHYTGYIWHMGYPIEPHLEHRHHCREHFTLDQWTQLTERNSAELRLGTADEHPTILFHPPLPHHLCLRPSLLILR